MKQITAICEIHDQCTGIKRVRIIDYTEEAMSAFEEEMDELMDTMGYRITFIDAIMPDFDYSVPAYDWMYEHEHLEIDRPL